MTEKRVSLSETRRETTYTDVGNADIARSKYLSSMVARTRSRPPWMEEVQVLQEQKPAMRVTVSESDTLFIFQ